ncbi:MAG TPA: DUF6398 domain-containing protein [Acidimicrobiia bacterium]|nr:DUF6398 domain-containing protein [Acidimicrobiia bacterium]
MVSTLLAVTDPRGQDPFEMASGKEVDGPSIGRLVTTFADVDIPETTALLSVIATMSDDEMAARRARRAAALRRHKLPDWLRNLTPIEVGRVMEMTHVLGDGDNIFVEFVTGSGETMTVVVYIDHNLGTLIKDAFVVPEPLDSLFALYGQEADEDTRFNDLDPATAQARIHQAGEMAAITYPPFESDTWPACRAFVEWVVREMPEGGRGYVRPEWDEDDRRRLSKRFLSSPYARSLNDDDADLFDSLLWFGCDYGPGDPLRWSPVAVEMFLVDWLPRKVIADAEFLGRAPDLLRAYVAFCHEEKGIRPIHTEETLEAIDRWEPVFRAKIETSPLASFPGLLADGDFPSFEEVMLESLAEEVGGDDVLAALDDKPLPDEPFDWTDIPTDVKPKVEAVLELCDRYCDTHLDVEYRTACRRLLARIVRGDPEVFRRRGRSDTAAAAVCWAIGKANRLFDSGTISVKDMMASFGLSGSVSQRTMTLLQAGGFDGDRFKFHSRLGTPDLIVSSRRAKIIRDRDQYSGESTV